MDQPAIQRAAVIFIQSLLSSEAAAPSSADFQDLLDCIPHIITEANNIGLMQKPSLEEVILAVNKLPKDSAPGPDSLSGVFFSGCWNTIGKDILATVEAFFQGSELRRAFSVTLICLVPKKLGVKSFSDYRPISPCNVVYKIFATIILDRLSTILPKVISLEQGAFVRGRSIDENVALAQELFRDVDRKVRGGNIVLKLDMEKAYDRVEWNFLRQVLLKFGFSASWVNLVQSFLFLNGSKRSLLAIKKFLSDYQSLSGQRINLHKSSFFCSSKLSNARIRGIHQSIGVNKSAGNLVYLGVPIFKGRAKRSFFAPLLDKMAANIQGWPNLHWRKWSSIAKPKAEGGLGTRQLKDVMTGLHLKMAWTIKQKDNGSLWGQFIRSKYTISSHPRIGQFIRSKYTISSHPRSGSQRALLSPIWNRMMDLFPVVDKFALWILGRGYCNMWSANWIGLGPLDSLPSLHVSNYLRHMKVSDFLDGEGIRLDAAVLLPIWLKSHIISGGFCTSDADDSLIWPLEPSGLFLVKSAWNISQFRGQVLPWSNKIWNPKIPLKISVFLWRLLHDALPVDVLV
ncbi:uncharacterized protein LOC131226864 [Magnolia sinica]|uniref:uncharacterized protein LOC131226864 n=1 Tax=Magnolia sinica TaxID=86752 RepID=UPI00265A566E|nr:uncharacterized protein LOC131226864 [Magnolia sinica]